MQARRRSQPFDPDHWQNQAVRYLARRDRTVAQVQQYLLQQGASASDVTRTIGRLTDLRYLDDRAYAERWLEHRIARHPMGRIRLTAELRGRGIAEPLAEEVVRAFLQTTTEEDLARRAVKSRRSRGSRPTLAQAVQLLRQRGFEEETIDRIIKAPHHDE